MIPYRDFYYPLNVFMHILTHEEGEVRYLHYGLFDRNDEAIGIAQERSTSLLLSRLPPPPARILDVGSGLGTTLMRLVAMGYDAEGITPDEKQVALIRSLHGADAPVRCVAFESLDPSPFDAVVFQESSQYIEPGALFSRLREMTPAAIVLDEFAMRPLDEPGALHGLDPFLRAASAHGFREIERIDVSERAAPTIDYFMKRLPRYRRALCDELGLDDAQIDQLLESGERYRTRYADGTYRYLLLRFAR